MHKVYAYINGEIGEQNSKIQLESLKHFEKAAKIKYKDIFEDKFKACLNDYSERTQYKALKEIVKDGDRIIVMEINVISKNMNQLCSELEYFISKNVRVEFVEIPIINTRDVELDNKINHLLLIMGN